ncbi:MAG TPA: creatininase family protein [Fimbriimonadaceae bacterium]|nr:creatininase family protein [Fimbriimonadaceae bacterium]
MIRYAEAFPCDLDRALERQAPIVWPLGALEWHGDHLPLGTDGLLSTAFAERLAEALDGVLLPTTWIPMTTLPHRFSLDVRSATFESLVADQLSALARAGWKVLIVITGHYAQGQEILLYRIARTVMDEHEGLMVFAAAPLEPLGDSMLDHAGRIEASQMLACRPDLVRLQHISQDAVVGQPPEDASELRGRELLNRAVDAWVEWTGDPDRRALKAAYVEAEARYQPYVERFFRGDWDEAIRAWWSNRSL